MRRCRHIIGSGCKASGALVVSLLWSCGDGERLGEEWVAPEQPQQDEDLGPRSPLEAGTRLWYTFSTSYRRLGSGGGGLTEGEAQTGGALCMEIVEVLDTATQAYKNADETIVESLARVTGTAGEPLLSYSDQNEVSATPEGVDALMQSLWLKRLTVPAAFNPLKNPTTTLFRTQAGPLPDAGLSGLPFFEVRPQPERNWSGWEYNVDMEGAENITGRLISSLDDPRSAKTRIITPPQNCGDYEEVHECTEHEYCTWTSRAGGNEPECLSLYTVRMVWRGSIDSPPELAGSVFHQVEFMYDTDGILHGAEEKIVPDSGGSVPQIITGCSQKCLSGGISNNGVYGDEASHSAPCEF